MILRFQRMTTGHAQAIAQWGYGEPYSRYGYDSRDSKEVVAELTDRSSDFFAVLAEGELVAFRSFGPDGQVVGGAYSEAYLDTGGGLRPDLTGRGWGGDVLLQGLRFGAVRFGTTRFRVTVATFNVRALKVCRAVGFQERQRFRRIGDGEEFCILTFDFL
jgi:[ribosomal protein S18]-alanine N-acetyltransferase